MMSFPFTNLYNTLNQTKIQVFFIVFSLFSSVMTCILFFYVVFLLFICFKFVTPSRLMYTKNGPSVRWTVFPQFFLYDYIFFSAWSRSSSRSSLSSNPIHMRTRSSVTPALAFSSSLEWTKIVDAGWMTGDRRIAHTRVNKTGFSAGKNVFHILCRRLIKGRALIQRLRHTSAFFVRLKGIMQQSRRKSHALSPPFCTTRS